MGPTYEYIFIFSNEKNLLKRLECQMNIAIKNLLDVILLKLSL